MNTDDIIYDKIMVSSLRSVTHLEAEDDGRLMINNYFSCFVLQDLQIFHESDVAIIAPNQVGIIENRQYETVAE